MIEKKIGWKPARTSILILLLFFTNIMLQSIINPGDKMKKGDISFTDILKVKTKLKKYFNCKSDEIFIIIVFNKAYFLTFFVYIEFLIFI